MVRFQFVGSLLAALLLVSLTNRPVCGQDAAVTPPVVDWMIQPAPFTAQIREDKSKQELILENGLARRTIRLAPNAATISLRNLVSGEELLRAVSPEARVTLDGVEYPLGGLDGQRVMNYLKAEWVDELRDNPDAYHFADWRELPVSERLKWKKRHEWLAKEHAWPPPGKHIVMRYVPPASPPRALEGKVVYREQFGQAAVADNEWKIVTSPTNERNSWNNEGKSGEVFSEPNVCVYAERAWPEGAASVELTLDTGDDTVSNAWGPGLAMVASDGSIVSFVVRPNQQVFETSAGIHAGFDRDQAVQLRARIHEKRLLLEARQGDAEYKRIAHVAYDKTPSQLRIGKVGAGGAGKDHSAGGELVRCHVLELVIGGAESAAAATTPRTDLPEVEVHYELYDGLPLFSKWLVVTNTTATPVRVNRFVSDELRLCEAEARGGDSHGPGSERERPNLYVETDMAFGGRMYAAADNHAVKLEGDPHYHTHVNYSYAPPTLLTVAPRTFHLGGGVDPTGAKDKLIGPDQEVAPGKTFESFRAFELLLDSNERERRTLAQRKMYRVLAPWTHENPLMFHKTDCKPAVIRDAIDQAADAGFEMVIMSFGSGFNFESRNRKYWDTYKELAEYGKSKGVVLGGYSLLASRSSGDGTNTVGPTMFGSMPCLGAQWGQDYLKNIVDFARYAGLGVFENDGSYPGECCSAKNHPFHQGYEDSQWVNWRAMTGQYQQLKAEGVFLNVPDWYFLSGSNKCGMGYRESNWTLPRAEQEIIERQTMYDGTWTKTQSMGWMFVPLSSYGGGAASTIEPLHEHLPHYEARLANLLGYGVQACYRGPRLYDTEETKAVVTKWTKFYKDHRDVLDNGDLIHLRRADGRDWDGVLHANPLGKEKGLAFFYNPQTEDIEREIRVPLYYTGLAGKAEVVVDGNSPQTASLDAANSVNLKLNIPAQGRVWVLFKEAR